MENSSDQSGSLSVSALNAQVRILLEHQIGVVTVHGEVSGFFAARSGHWYFTLKDAQAQVRCAMFRSDQQGAALPCEGDQVQLRARVGLYTQRGDYQLIVTGLSVLGGGLLMQRFTALKKRLDAEGLFDAACKKPLPVRLQIRHLAVVTSPQGAAVRDVLSILARRMPTIAVTIVPTAVQGTAAVTEIVHALRRADALGVDVVLLTRGGGSIEDLWCFNEEAVVRAIAECHTPVVSAIGHEIDFSLSDFVADARAPTPSAAGEILSAEREVLLRLCAERMHDLQQCIHRKLQAYTQQLDFLAQKLWRMHPHQVIADQEVYLENLQQGLLLAMTEALKRRTHRLEILQTRLAAMNPQGVLQRGYAWVTNTEGQLVDNATRLQPGEKIQVRLRQGHICATVSEIVRQDVSTESTC